MPTIDRILSVIFIACFSYLMVSAYALRWMIDGQKIKDEGPKLFRAITPPRHILTPMGVRVWWSRLGALAIGMACLFGVFYFRAQRTQNQPNSEAVQRTSATPPYLTYESLSKI